MNVATNRDGYHPGVDRTVPHPHFDRNLSSHLALEIPFLIC